MTQKQALQEALDEIQKELTQIQDLKKLVKDLSEALDDSRRMVLYDNEYRRLQERAKEAIK